MRAGTGMGAGTGAGAGVSPQVRLGGLAAGECKVLLEEGLCTPRGQPTPEIPRVGRPEKTEGKNKTIEESTTYSNTFVLYYPRATF